MDKNQMIEIYHDPNIRNQLFLSLSHPPFQIESCDPAYFGYSKGTDCYVIAASILLNGEEGGVFWAFQIKEEQHVKICHLYFGLAEDTYWDILSIIKLKYPDLYDIVLD